MNAEPVIYYPARPFNEAREIHRRELRELGGRLEETRQAYNAATLWAWACMSCVALSAGIGIAVLLDGQYLAAVVSAAFSVSFGHSFLRRLPVIGALAREQERLAARYEVEAKEFWDSSRPKRRRSVPGDQ